MEEWKTSLEIIAPTVEEAVARGAAELGLPAEALEVEVLDEGGKGLFGVGVRQARVRLRVRSAPETAPAAATPKAAPADEAPAEWEDDTPLQAARGAVEELILRMGFRAQVSARWAEPVDPPDVRPLLVDVRGRDLHALIGRRGATLSALQYLTRLIVAKELGRHVPILIDIDGYRARREAQLRRLARRMADQAVETARTMVLEPMSAYERRIIHLELRDHPSVYTESIDEGDRRKVTIIPRR